MHVLQGENVMYKKQNTTYGFTFLKKYDIAQVPRFISEGSTQIAFHSQALKKIKKKKTGWFNSQN